MNNGPSASASVDDPTVHLEGDSNTPSPFANGNANTGTATDVASTSSYDSSSPAALYLKARVNALRGLLAALDGLVYIEISALYYMDTASILLFLRVIVQFTYLTPKPANLPVPQSRPYIGAILGTNILCFIVHIFDPPPAASEYTRSYLHGSLLIDFIGQKGPTSKAHLLLLDLLILGLQLLSLAVVVQLTREKKSRRAERSGTEVSPSHTPGIDTISGNDTPNITTRDNSMDDRGSAGLIEAVDGIELQPMSSRSGAGVTHTPYSSSIRTNTNSDIESNSNPTTIASPNTNDQRLESQTTEEHIPLLPSPAERRPDIAAIDQDDGSTTLPLDHFYSGQSILANLHIIDTIRNQFWDYQSLRRGGRV